MAKTKLRIESILLALIRADQRYWNWVTERAPILVRTWFEWLRWILTLSALQYVAVNFRSRLAFAIVWISYMLLLFYFHAIYISCLEEPRQDPVTGITRRSMGAWLAAFAGASWIILTVQGLVRAIMGATGK